MFDAIERLSSGETPGSSLIQVERVLGEHVGRHEVVGVLGSSARTEVLLACTRGPHGFTRRVVLKRLRDDATLNEMAVRHFAREAMAYARVAHPSVVHLYDVIEHEGRLVLVLEYVPGLSLGRLRRLLHPRKETLNDACSIYVMAHVFAGLAAAHAASDPSTGEFLPVVHRDVTPSNVLIGRDGAVKLTDFGIARVTGVESDTRAGLLKGTYGYMAPEQVLGDAITPRTDVYCACLVLRELLLRRPTFARDGEPELELLDRMAHPQLAPIESLRSGVPARICELLQEGLRERADERGCTAAEMRDALFDHVSFNSSREQLIAKLADVSPHEAPGLHEQSVSTCPSDWMIEQDTLPNLDVEEPPFHSRVMPIVRAPASEPPPPSAPPPRSTLTTVPSLPRPGAPGRRRALLGATALGLAGLAACGVSLLARGERRATYAAGLADKAPRSLGRALEASRDVVAEVEVPLDEALGELRAPPSPWSHRLFVDGQLVGETRSAVRVPCGPHLVKVGGRGALQRVLVPCGGVAVVEPRSE